MDNLIRVTKAMLWEEAKGKLQALVSVEGQVPPHDDRFQARRVRWRRASLEVENFIKTFEEHGLHE